MFISVKKNKNIKKRKYFVLKKNGTIESDIDYFFWTVIKRHQQWEEDKK